MSNQIELTPCPFCGGNATLYVENGVRVKCRICGASTIALTDHMGNGSAVESVIKKWNRREGEKETKKDTATEHTRVFVENSFTKCGHCHCVVRKEYKYCPVCGTLLDWSRVEV